MTWSHESSQRYTYAYSRFTIPGPHRFCDDRGLCGIRRGQAAKSVGLNISFVNRMALYDQDVISVILPGFRPGPRGVSRVWICYACVCVGVCVCVFVYVFIYNM
jgi:hypothetical protein